VAAISAGADDASRFEARASAVVLEAYPALDIRHRIPRSETRPAMARVTERMHALALVDVIVPDRAVRMMHA
jgi:hypothetical protein